MVLTCGKIRSPGSQHHSDEVLHPAHDIGVDNLSAATMNSKNKEVPEEKRGTLEIMSYFIVEDHLILELQK